MKLSGLMMAGSVLLGSGYAFGAKSYSCKSNTSAEVRTIEVVEEVPGKSVPCKVNYTVANKTEVKFTASNKEGYCEKGADRIKNNLETANFTCTESGQMSDPTPQQPEQRETPEPAMDEDTMTE